MICLVGDIETRIQALSREITKANMKYPREREASANFLKLILQRMVEHPATLTPFCYAVWYEHLAGLNPRLSEALNKMFDNKVKLDDETVETLYAHYVSNFDFNTHSELHENVTLLLSNLTQLLADTDKQAIGFGDSLQKYGNTLKGKLTVKDLDSLIKYLAKDMELMRGSMQQMSSQLNASKQEVETLQRALESARNESMIDPLTGVYNRRGFESRINAFFTDPGSENSCFCLLMLDIDHFKKVNDTFGHLFGDKVICSIANAIKLLVKGQDIVARLGGEEFVVLLPQTNATGAFVVAEKIRQTIEHGKIRRQDNQGEVGGITISIGSSAYVKGCSMASLIDQADRALYLSKQNGRNQTTVFAENDPAAKPVSGGNRKRG